MNSLQCCLIINIGRSLEISKQLAMSNLIRLRKWRETIENHEFRTDAKFNSDPKCLKFLIEYVHQMIPSSHTILLARKIIQKYQLPILIAFQPFYDRIGPVQQLLYSQELYQISKLVTRILHHRFFAELSFFWEKVPQQNINQEETSHEGRTGSMSADGEHFANYCHQLSILCHQINTLAAEEEPKCLSLVTQVGQLSKEFERILHEGTYFNDNKIRILENNYVNILRKRVHFHIKAANKNYAMEQESEQLTIVEAESQADTSIQSKKATESESDERSTEEEQYKVMVALSLKNAEEDQNEVDLSPSQLPVSEQNENFVPMCCRRYFKDGDILYDPQDDCFDILKANFPLSAQSKILLKQKICSFLNTEGGIILVNSAPTDIQLQDTTISGHSLTENQKEEVTRQVRMVSQSIMPDIITNKLYLVEFVPVVRPDNEEEFLKGMFVVRIKVKLGVNDEIYSYKEGDTDLFPFRMSSMICNLEGRELLHRVKCRFENPRRVPMAAHEGPCTPPLTGYIHYEEDKPNVDAISSPPQKMIQGERKEQAEIKKKRKFCLKEENKVDQEMETAQASKNKFSCFGRTQIYLLKGLSIDFILCLLEREKLLDKIAIQEKDSRISLITVTKLSFLTRVRKFVTSIADLIDGPRHLYQIVPVTKFLDLKCKGQKPQVDKLLKQSQVVHLVSVKQNEENYPDEEVTFLRITFTDTDTAVDIYIALEKEGFKPRFVLP